MVTSINELNQTLSEARFSFLNGMKYWLGMEPESRTLESWMKALMETETVETLYETISSLGLFVAGSSLEIDDEFSSERDIRDYQFDCYDNSPLELKKICCLTNLYAQLLHITSLIKPLESIPLLNSIKLAQMMATHVNAELELVEKTPLNLRVYQQRLEQVRKQSNLAYTDNVDLIRDTQNDDYRANEQLSALLPLFVTTLMDAWALENDDRYLTSFRALLPWHALIWNLARSVFGEAKVHLSSKCSLDIQGQWSTDVYQLMEEARKKRIDNIKEAHAAVIKGTEKDIEQIEDWLSIPKHEALVVDERAPARTERSPHPGLFYATYAARAGVIPSASSASLSMNPD